MAHLASLNQVEEIWMVDFEFRGGDGDPPDPVCMVAKEFKSGRAVRLWEDELKRLPHPPYPVDERAVVIAYYASAEMTCHLALGWPLPRNLLDFFTEFRVQTNGRPLPCGAGLLGALAYHDLGGIEAAEKTSMRDLILRGGPWSAEERVAILAYCETDVTALERLMVPMSTGLDLPRALIRGRFMKSVAWMEINGVPIDTRTLENLRRNWSDIRLDLVRQIDSQYGVFEGETFKVANWERWLERNGIPWPRLESGKLMLDEDTFREMARAHPLVAPIQALRHSLSQMRLEALAVGKDGRNRCLLSAFRSRTGRNQPSNSAYIFGPSVWLRSLIQPAPGFGLAYIDWEQQEFAIAAVLSGDPAMIAAYESGDPYLTFGKQCGAIPWSGTKETHKELRESFKAAALAVQYGMGPDSLGQRIGVSVVRARELLELHRRTYRTFWEWSDAVVDFAMLNGYLYTVFGWMVHVTPGVNVRFLRNFPMQGNGSEMLRLACSEATERGIRVCAPVHDALLIEAPLDNLVQVVRETQKIMEDASAAVLDGFRLRSDAKLVRYPDRYTDPRGHEMWNRVSGLLTRQEFSPTTP